MRATAPPRSLSTMPADETDVLAGAARGAAHHSGRRCMTPPARSSRTTRRTRRRMPSRNTRSATACASAPACCSTTQPIRQGGNARHRHAVPALEPGSLHRADRPLRADRRRRDRLRDAAGVSSRALTAAADLAARADAGDARRARSPEKRDYTVRAPKLGNDELGALTDAFNHMLDQLTADIAERNAAGTQAAAAAVAARPAPPDHPRGRRAAGPAQHLPGGDPASGGARAHRFRLHLPLRSAWRRC